MFCRRQTRSPKLRPPLLLPAHPRRHPPLILDPCSPIGFVSVPIAPFAAPQIRAESPNPARQSGHPWAGGGSRGISALPSPGGSGFTKSWRLAAVATRSGRGRRDQIQIRSRKRAALSPGDGRRAFPGKARRYGRAPACVSDVGVGKLVLNCTCQAAAVLKRLAADYAVRCKSASQTSVEFSAFRLLPRISDGHRRPLG